LTATIAAPPQTYPTTNERKSKLGQFFTSDHIAAFMAGLFPVATGQCRLLDPGAGAGALAQAFIARQRAAGACFEQVKVQSFEIDPLLSISLRSSLENHIDLPLSHDVFIEDFIETAVRWLCFEAHPGFSHAILNPPYKKLASHSPERFLLRQVGIETVNFYSAFVALALLLMQPGGLVVAIIPRSFCNGPYYQSFRKFILQKAAIKHIHLFASRDQVFKNDAVLQENIIIMLEYAGKKGEVTVSTSTDDSFNDLISNHHPFTAIVTPDDPDCFIHIPSPPTPQKSQQAAKVTTEAGLLESIAQCSLDDLAIQVSTGPVVDFRLQSHLRELSSPTTVPLIYPTHISHGAFSWPKLSGKKPNAIEYNPETAKWLYPNGFYCAVKRFSAKEEARRIVATAIDPAGLDGSEQVGFKQGLPAALAYGLAVYLNSTFVDDHFRLFSGHTQVNATDLRRIKYPSRSTLMLLGKWALQQPQPPTQTVIDQRIKDLQP
jgi:adenine-specific DNA-methyltransferase